jgi:hypothetical protein
VEFVFSRPFVAFEGDPFLLALPCFRVRSKLDDQRVGPQKRRLIA